MNSKEHGKKAEQVRKLIGAALCDFVNVLGESKDAFIVGGQYPRERLLVELRDWLQTRNFNVAGIGESSSQWLNLCASHAFCGREGDDMTPTPKPTPEPTPEPKPKPKPPKAGTPGKPPTPPPVGADGTEEGYLNGDDWKAKEDRKDNWQDEGEDWKKGNEDD